MSKIRGKKGFESPSQEDLDDYLRKSRKSITQMKEGKPPIIFKPKRTLPVKFIGILMLLVVSSSLMLGGSILNLDSPIINDNDDTTTTTTTTKTTTTTTATITTQIETTQPLDTEEDILTTIPQVEAFISPMIASNLSLINPIMVNGTINQSHVISEIELFDLAWILSQFEENSDWWNLGRTLIFETYNMWNNTYYLSENLRFELLALRSLIAYSPQSIFLEANELEAYQNLSKQLWQNISSVYNNETGTINLDNDTMISTADQILFSQVLTRTANHPTLFNFSTTQEMANQLLITFNAISNPINGLPETFDNNLTVNSEISYSCQQSETILTLDKLKILLGSLPVIDTLTLRLNNFQTNVFLQQDWSVANSHNRTSDDLSIKLVLRDQLFFIRANAVQDKRNFAGFTISILKSIFGSVNSSYYSTTEDNVNQFLGDHLHLLLAFEAFLNLDKPTTTTADATSTTRTEDPTGSAGYAWEFVIIIITFAFISYRRRQKKR